MLLAHYFELMLLRMGTPLWVLASTRPSSTNAINWPGAMHRQSKEETGALEVGGVWSELYGGCPTPQVDHPLTSSYSVNSKEENSMCINTQVGY